MRARRTKTAPKCTCPACLADYYTSPQGVFYCLITRDYAAYGAGSALGFYASHPLATEALGVYLIDQARAEAVEVAAAEADLAHDVAQADAALVAIASLDDAEICRLIAAMPPLPPPLYYDRHHRGVTWAGASEVYPDFIAADAARAEWIQGE